MKELTPLLKELAEKLGTTIENIWSVLIYHFLLLQKHSMKITGSPGAFLG